MKSGSHIVALCMLLPCMLIAAGGAAMPGPLAKITVSVYLDDTLPFVTLSSAAPSATNTTPIPVVVQFSEAVTGFEAGDIVVSNAVIEDFQGAGAQYALNLAPLGEGMVTADIPPGVAHDTTGNPNTPANPFMRLYDITPPTGAIVINNDDIFTRTVDVGLGLGTDDGAGAGVTDMAFRNAGMSWSEWLPVSSPSPWVLEEGEGYKTVEARYRDAADNVSTADIADTIALDTTPLELTVVGDTLVNRVERDSYTFEVVASGVFGTPSYQWLKESQGSKDLVPVPGANAPTYTIDELQTGDSGHYFCEASDETETALSPEIQLFVGSGMGLVGAMGLIVVSVMLAAAALLALHQGKRKPTPDR